MNPKAKMAPPGLSNLKNHAEQHGLKPPLARREPVETILHGDRRVDHYAWLREKENPEVLAYLENENAYTDALLAATQGFQDELYQEMLARIQQTDMSVPYRLRGYLYFTATEQGQQYPIRCRKLDQLGALDEVLVDLNRLAQGHSFLGLGAFEVSRDNQLLAYAVDTSGFRQYKLQIKSLLTGEIFPEVMERVTSVAWAADNRTLFYTVEDATTKRSHRLYRHLAGSTYPDVLVYEEADERFRVSIESSRSGAFLFLSAESHTTSEVRFLPAREPLGEFRLIAPRETDHEYFVDHHPNPLTREPRGANADDIGGYFLIRTNSGGRTFRLVSAPVANPKRENWREVVPNRPDVMLTSAHVFRSHIVLCEREGGLPHLRVVDLSIATPDVLSASHRIAFTEPAYSASLGDNPDFDANFVRYNYESFITPRSTFDYDVGTRTSVLRKQQPVLGGYDPTQYSCERLHASAADGVQIPISLIRRRDAPLDGSGPLLLYGYGSYGYSIAVTFNANRVSLLDRGVAYAVAHVRGGGELGKPWHDAGRMHNKRNTFTDFIAAAEHLVAERYTAPQNLMMEGGSAGGLLMGAVTNMRPDLFRIVVSHVPFVDVINTMLDTSLPLTVGEFEEWGNPRVAEDYFYMKTYCPYTNLEAKPYPTILVKTALNDSQVMYWEPAKYVAKMRALKADSNVLLLKTNMGAGHGGASGRYDYLREIALDYAFLLTELGIHA
jgi:oligopeptidase B